MRLIAALPLMLAGLATPALAQQPGWHYSPLPGEGDRAAIGCDTDATAQAFTCLVVRCEDDMSVGLHIHTSAATEALGEWVLTIDEGPTLIATVAAAAGDPYAARVSGEVTEIIDDLKQGAVAFLDRRPEQILGSAAIPLGGSLRVINQALYFCPTPQPEIEPAPDPAR